MTTKETKEIELLRQKIATEELKQQLLRAQIRVAQEEERILITKM
jgi:hypothetical protein